MCQSISMSLMRDAMHAKARAAHYRFGQIRYSGISTQENSMSHHDQSL